MAIIGVALARNAETAQRVVITFSCDNSLSVGDVVYQSLMADQTVVKIIDNYQVNQAIGICVEKPASTTAKILVLGIAEGFSGLTTGGRIYLSSSGSITTTKPTSGYLHNLGVAVSATDILFIPNNIRTKLI